MKKNILILLIVLGLFVLGYFRDNLFVNINYLIYHLYYKTDQLYLSPSFLFLKRFDYDTLWQMKWVLTLLFFFTYLFFTLLGVYLVFGLNKKNLIYAIAFYLFIFLISGLFYGLGYFAGYIEWGYHFARIFMGLAQSPFVLIFLIPAFTYFSSKEQKT